MTVARGGKRGKTSGRGGKGQTARAGNKRRPEWRDIIKKLPKLRGRGKNSNISFYKRPTPISIDLLESVFASGEAVSPAILAEKGIVSTLSGRILEVKILGGDKPLTKALKLSGCAVSVSAKAAIEKAGGTVTAVTPKAKTKIVAERTGPKAGTVDAPKAKPEAAKDSNKAAQAKKPADTHKAKPAAAFKSEAAPSKEKSKAVPVAAKSKSDKKAS